MGLKAAFTRKSGKRMLAGILSAALILSSSGMIPVKAEMTQETIDAASQMVCYAVGGKVDGVEVSRAKSEGNSSEVNDILYLNEIVTGDAEKNKALVDGDTDAKVKYGTTRVVFIDMGEKEVSKVEVYGAANNYCFATGDVDGFDGGQVPASITKGTPVKYTTKGIIRLNNNNAYSYGISNSNLVYGDSVVTISGIDFGRFLIIDANGSQYDIAEVKVYTGEDDPVPPTPGRDVAIAEDGKVDLSTATTYEWSESNGTGSTNPAILFDGQTESGELGGNKKYAVFDLGKAYAISKIRLQCNTTHHGNFVAVSNDDKLTTGNTSAKSTPVLRNNNQTQNGVPIISAVGEGTTSDQTVGPIKPTGGDDTSGRYRYILVYNRSVDCTATELEVYVNVWKVTVQQDGGESQEYQVPDGKMVACHSDEDVAWTIDDQVLAIGKKFTYIPTGNVEIVAKKLTPEMTAEGIVTDGSVTDNNFTVTFGESVTGNVIFTFVTEDRKAAEVTAQVEDGFAGSTVKYTITGAEDKNIQYVIARKEG